MLHNKSRLLAASSFAYLFILSGCSSTASKFDCDVNALSSRDGAAHHKIFAISSSDKNILRDELQFTEFSGYVEQIMKSKCFVKADDYNKADVLLLLSYGVNEPKTHIKTYEVPVYDPAGVSKVTTHTYGSDPSGKIPVESISTTTYTPEHGIVGYKEGKQTYVTYDHYITLVAYELLNDPKKTVGKQLWKTSVVTTSHSGDLRYVFPYLLTAMKPHIAKNTKHVIRVEIKENNAKADRLRRKGEIPVCSE